jgi:hypothetical protein
MGIRWRNRPVSKFAVSRGGPSKGLGSYPVRGLLHSRGPPSKGATTRHAEIGGHPVPADQRRGSAPTPPLPKHRTRQASPSYS